MRPSCRHLPKIEREVLGLVHGLYQDDSAHPDLRAYADPTVDVGTGVGVAVAKEALGRYLDLLAVKNLSVSYKEGRRTSTHP